MPAALLGRLRAALIILSTIATGATLCLLGASAAQATSRAGDRSSLGKRIVRVARHQTHDPYVYGANGPGAFDCSGFTQFVYRKAGKRLPRTTAAQYRHARHIPKGNVRRGDLMFFHSGGNIYHAAIFAGWRHGQRMLWHASQPGTTVKKDPVWTGSWYAATRRPH